MRNLILVYVARGQEPTRAPTIGTKSATTRNSGGTPVTSVSRTRTSRQDECEWTGQVRLISQPRAGKSSVGKSPLTQSVKRTLFSIRYSDDTYDSKATTARPSDSYVCAQRCRVTLTFALPRWPRKWCQNRKMMRPMRCLARN